MVAGSRRFLGIALVVGGGALVATLRAAFAGMSRPAFDSTAPTGPVPPAALATLLAFTEVVVLGETLPGDGREAVQASLQESATTRPGHRALCEAAAVADALAAA